MLIALTGVAVFLLHPWPGVLALLSTGVLLGLGVLTETRSRGPYRLASRRMASATPTCWRR